jgi:ApbE superfamily uncharacterized protein (UPF0280 family)
LPLLRTGVASGACPLRGPVARRMWQACAALPVSFITPMAAVAGAVAQEILAPYAAAGLPRASVNNGGDIALHLGPGAQWRIGAVSDIASAVRRGRSVADAAFTVRADDPVRGVATSGWRGRSHSLGIADAVTVLAATAAQADAAATVLANAVDLDHPGIARVPACELRHDSDLGQRRVTTDVPPLAPHEARRALQRGLVLARRLQTEGLIHAAMLVCQGEAVSLDPQLDPHLQSTLEPAAPALPLAA